MDQIILNVQTLFFISWFIVGNFTNPWMIKELFDRGSSILISFKTNRNKIFGVLWNFLPLFLGERKFFQNNIIIDFLDILSVKWSNST